MDYTTNVPEEILAYIFMYVQTEDPCARMPRLEADSDNSDEEKALVAPPSRDALLGWIRITFVNRRWRRVAIEDATLWMHLNGELGAVWVNEFIKRSKDAGLSIDDDYFYFHNTEQHPSVHPYVVAHHTRLASLRLDENRTDIPHVLSATESCSFGILEDLRITHWSNVSVGMLDGVKPLILRTPRLRSLHLHLPRIPWTALDWQLQCLSRLTSLNLNLSIRTSTGVTTPAFLNALCQMRALSQLVLFEIILYPADHLHTSTCNHCSTASPNPVADLKSMRSMAVFSPTYTHAHLMRHIRLPRGTRLGLYSARPTGHEPDPYRHLARELSKQPFMIHNKKASSFRSAHMRFYEDHIPALNNVFVALTSSATPSAPPISVFLNMNVHTLMAGNDLIIPLLDTHAPEVILSLPVNSIHTLTVLNAGVSSMRAHLIYFRNVERLTIRVHTMMDTKHGIGLLEDPEILPTLRLVDLHGDDFDLHSVLKHFTSHGPLVVPTRFSVLENVLEARRHMGAPLQAVYLHIAEEVALAKVGRVNETSCKGVEQTILLESIRQLEAVRGVEIVSKEFAVFLA